MSDQIVWEDPPPKHGRGTMLPLFAAARERPGEWASIESPRAGQWAANVRRGFAAGVAAGEFEATARKGRLYVRYVGKPNLKAAQ